MSLVDKDMTDVLNIGIFSCRRSISRMSKGGFDGRSTIIINVDVNPGV